MSNPFHRFRGLAIALAVLALSATVALAAPPAAHVSSTTPPAADKHSESPEPSESPEASETPDADSVEAPASTAPEDTHGALVSAAAQMPTPEGFANHGAFVSCVAHLDVTLAEVDWTTVSPATCDAASRGAEKAAAGKAKGEAGRAHGAAARAAHQPSR